MVEGAPLSENRPEDAQVMFRHLLRRAQCCMDNAGRQSPRGEKRCALRRAGRSGLGSCCMLIRTPVCVRSGSRQFIFFNSGGENGR